MFIIAVSALGPRLAQRNGDILFCSKCGTQNTVGSTYCVSCGSPLTQQTQPPTPPPPPPPPSDPRASGPYGSPGTGALWLSIFGFVCGVPAILGIIFGFGARREAKLRGRSPAKANWAIAIGIAWLLPVAITGFALVQGNSEGMPSQSENSQSAEQEPLPEEAVQGSEQEDEGPDLRTLRTNLIADGFTCDPYPGGYVVLIQCRKGTLDDPVYGELPKQLVNIRMAAGTVDGYGRPKTVELLREYLPVTDFGDDGTGTNTRTFGSE